MKIGFDLDKVFFDHPQIIPDAAVYWRYRKKANGTLLYRIPSRLEQLLRIFFHYPFFRPPIKENLSVLSQIAHQKNKLYLITSRFSFLKKRTDVILKKYGLADLFDSMYFNSENKQPHVFKNELIRKLNLDMFIDDDLPLLQYIAKHNKKTKLIWLNSSKGKKSHLENILPVSSLRQLFS